MEIISKFKVYSVDFIDNLNELTDMIDDVTVFFVIDGNVFKHYDGIFSTISKDRLYVLDAVEQKKDIDTVMDICEKMTVMPSKRNTHLVSIGGGITQDITGFVANVLYRGIKWSFFPSTLLAACDSCIGGKTSLNCKNFKNLLGTFYPPDSIMIYSGFFKTLSEMDYYSGLGEVVKFNIMAGKDGVDRIEENIDILLMREEATITKFCFSSLLFKKSFIEEDEFDKGRRILLNFAHTFGHAFEFSSNYKIPHGSAVALGMIVANRISVKRGILDDVFAKKVEKICKKILKFKIEQDWIRVDVIISAIRKDKKQTNSAIRAVLLNRNLELFLCDDISEQEISDAMGYLKFTFGNVVECC